MSKFDDVVRKASTALPPEELDMTLVCQKCNVQVDVGLYFATEKILTWTCPAGHKSFIEGFNLFG